LVGRYCHVSQNATHRSTAVLRGGRGSAPAQLGGRAPPPPLPFSLLFARHYPLDLSD